MPDREQIELLQHNLIEALREGGFLETEGVEDAFRAVPRHLFLPHLPVEQVYQNQAIGIKKDANGLMVSSSSQPAMMAIMLEQLQLRDGDNVLEIGAATGYNAAIMEQMVGRKGSVTSIEIDKDLADQAQKNLATAHSRVRVVNADGVGGYAPRAAYDHIVATVGVHDIPAAWFSQLKSNGSLVVPIVMDGIMLSANIKEMSDGTYMSVDNRPCSFVYLRGSSAAPPQRRQVGSSSLYILSDEIEKIDTAGIALLLKEDHEYCNFDRAMSVTDFWYGFQLYLMLNAPREFIFTVFSVIQGQTAFGVDGDGVALFSRASASLANYREQGMAHCYGGADAFLAMQSTMDRWVQEGQPKLDKLRLRLIPREMGMPEIQRGRIYPRSNHYLHVWFEIDAE